MESSSIKLPVGESAGRADEANSVETRGVRRRYGPTIALDGVDLEVRAGEVHALLGGNGSGKSTLIRILSGVEGADSGSVAIGGREFAPGTLSPAMARALGVHVVHQRPTTFGSLSVAENLAAGERFPLTRGTAISWSKVHRDCRSVLQRFGIEADPRQALQELRPAGQRMVEIARALQGQESTGSGVLILDEPTEALATPEVDALREALSRYAQAGQAILYVTHRLQELPGFAHRATVLRNGSVAAVLETAEIVTERLVGEISGPELADRVRARTPDELGKARLEARGIAGGAVMRVSLSVHAGEVVGLAGLAGSGRSSLLKLLFGVLPASTGSLMIDGIPFGAGGREHRSVAFLPEDRHRDVAFNGLSLRENLSAARVERFWSGLRLRLGAERGAASRAIADFSIKAQGPEASLGTLSGGNQQKAMLARWLQLRPSILLLDEPTQGVDVGARAEIHRFIGRSARDGGAIVVASSDYEELAALCDRVLVLAEGEITGELAGADLTPATLERAAHAV